MSPTARPKVLITGIAGVLGQEVARRLHQAGHRVMGIDRRDWPDPPRGVVVHLGTVTYFRAGLEARARINLEGTRRVFDNCARHGTRHVIFVGRHTVYGAGADSPLYHGEEDPPLGGATFVELADLLAADMYAGTALWRRPELTTTILRLVYTLGPSRKGTLARFLGGRLVPTVLGFDPLYHFMHERDAAAAIVAAARAGCAGIFNVAGPPPLPLSLLIRHTGRRAVPIPQLLYPLVLGRFGSPLLSHGAIQHVKYPIVVDDSAFRRATGFEHEVDETQTMEAFRLG